MEGLAYDFAIDIASAGGGAFVAREEPDPTCGTKVPLRKSQYSYARQKKNEYKHLTNYNF